MKVKQVIKLVRMKITDEDINRWEDYQIIDVINEAVRFIRNIFIEQQPTMIAKKVTGFLVEGENTIEFDFAPLKIVDIRCVGKRLHLTSIHNIDDTESEGTPKVFIPATTKCIEVYPVPDCSYKYAAFIIPPADELAEEDELPFPEDYSDNVIEYTAMRLSLIDEFNQSTETALISQIQSNVSHKLETYSPQQHTVDSY